jgi:hypothetical protein
MMSVELEWIEPLLWDAPTPILDQIYADAAATCARNRCSWGEREQDLTAFASYKRQVQQEFNRRLRILDIMVEGVTW